MPRRHSLGGLRHPWAILVISVPGLLAVADPYLGTREQMVHEQIEMRGIRNDELLRALRDTPRHLFIPAANRAMAYADQAVPIGFGATISQPYVVARMTELHDPQKTDRVLEIGTGSGYLAAILARLTKSVHTVEIVPELAKAAREVLSELGYGNVAVRQGDGYGGWPEEAPFDKIMAPVGRGLVQQLIVVDKDARGRIRYKWVGDVIFVPLRPGS
jgi:protein-L-isoaspartate(D-aspartate) O-methyltransferase